MDADVAVVGLGTMGSMTAWQLSRQGVSVLGFEQFGIGHDRSAYGGGSRRFRIASPLVEETPFIKGSYHMFRDLEQEAGQQLLSYSGALTIGDPDSQRMKNVMRSIQEYDLRHEILDDHEAMRRYPQHRLLPGEVTVWDEMGGVLRPEQIVIAAVNRARKLGAQVHSYTEVKDIQADETGVTIIAGEDEKEYRVGKVIVTAGPWANKLVPNMNKIYSAQRIIMTWFIPESPEQFTEEKFPNFSRLSGGRHIQGTPAIDGRLVRVSESLERAKYDSADHFDKNVSVEDILGVREAVKELIPNLNPDPVSIAPFMDGFTTDGLPIVGSTSKNENVILLCGFSGQGFSQSPAMGEIAAHLAMGNKTGYDIKHLSPKRFGL
ncbi:N-methyl-L-tryptophan oxidase [Ornithinibacillus sp. 4-3]|uniref:N-methyl-L-tryptophan oxidase n=1 Tax=Ornithinibacillus sp. 4-3 TaxID=3231488 RepID=A0AB39HJ17_9BACI